MAQVIPFRGIRYNKEKIQNLSEVVTPPYDVISKADQRKYYERSPYNIIRLDLNPPTDHDTAEDNPHTRAGRSFREWRANGVLTRDDKPAIYLTRVIFTVGGRSITRHGLIALVGLEPFDKRIILPHEMTFSKVKSERLDLLKACHTNFSPIFSIYSDQEGIEDALLNAAAGQAPEVEIVDDEGLIHAMWPITDPDALAFVRRSFAEKRLFIADGHHRYETALNYRQWVAENDSGYGPDHPANFVMMYLCSMEDPGLVILPAHRNLHDAPKELLADFPRLAKAYFDIESIPLDTRNRKASQTAFLQKLAGVEDRVAIGVYIRGSREFLLLLLKPHVMTQKFGDHIPEALRCLDVTVLTRLVLMEVLGYDQQRLDNEKSIGYSSDGQAALDAIEAGEYDVAFLLNPTKISQVKTVAEHGLIMPRKTTYFYPKVITGLVVNSLSRE